MSDTAFVVFTPSGKRGRFEIGTPLLECARRLGVDVDSVCGGRGICGRCQVVVGTGEFPKHGIVSHKHSVGAITPAELSYHQWQGLADSRRLSCHTRLKGDVVIDAPPESQVHRKVPTCPGRSAWSSTLVPMRK